MFENSLMDRDMFFNTGVSQSIANVKPLNSPDIERIGVSPGRYEEHRDQPQQYLLI